MPALPPVPNVIKSRLFWTIEGDPFAVTILFYHYTSAAPDDPDLSTMNTALNAAVTSDLPAMFQSGVTLEGNDSRDLSDPGGAYATITNPTPGTRAGTRLAPGTAAVSNYHVRQSYRGGKPRGYFPFGVGADVSTTGLWSDAFVTDADNAINSALNTVEDTFGGLTIDKQCVVSYYGPPNRVITNPTTGRARTVSTRRDAPGGTGHPLVYIITTRGVTKVIGSQRRRNRNA
jgi:hypothetical protein